MKVRHRKWSILAAAGLALGACTQPFIPSDSTRREERAALERRYLDVLASRTRRIEIHHNFQSLLSGYVVLRDGAFYEALRAYQRAAYGWDVRREAELVEQDRLMAGRTLDVLLAVTTSDPETNNFEHRRRFWQVTAVTGEGPPVQPSIIRKTEENPALLQPYYPFLIDWHSVYEIRFSTADGPIRSLHASGEPLTIRIMGPLGEAAAVFSVAVEADRPAP